MACCFHWIHSSFSSNKLASKVIVAGLFWLDLPCIVGVDVVVATPGKLIGLLDKGELSLDAISYLVIDEVDRFMKGMMEDDLRKIISAATSSLRPRQTLLFSATLPENLERLVRSAVLNPVSIIIERLQHQPQNNTFMYLTMQSGDEVKILVINVFPHSDNSGSRFYWSDNSKFGTRYNIHAHIPEASKS